MRDILLALPAMLSVVLSLVVSFHIYKRKAGPAWRYMSLGGLAVAWWCLGQTLWVLARDPETRLLIAKLQYLGITTTPVFWFLSMQAYGGSRYWLTGNRTSWLWVIPALTIVFAFTNESHHLIWEVFEPDPDHPRLIVTYGRWFPVNAGYAYLLVITGTAAAAWRLGASPLYRRQLIAVLIGPAAILGANLTHLTARTSLPIDPTPSSFAIAYILLGWSLLRHRLFELVPLARAKTLDSLHEGVIVVDRAGLVVDTNPAGASFLTGATPRPLGSPLTNLLPGIAGMPDGARQEFTLRERRIEADASTIVGKDGLTEGRVIVLRDVTEAREARDRLMQAQAELQRLNAELERIAHTDALTGLANRRRLLARLDEEWARARRHERPLSLIIFDLDHFKTINDSMGHLVGDRVLEAVGRSLQAIVRPMDVAARYGGEEFAVLLPEADLEGACETAKRICTALRALRHADGRGGSFEITLSGGVASLETHDDTASDLIARADAALYFTKQNGRNGVSGGRVTGEFRRLAAI